MSRARRGRSVEEQATYVLSIGDLMAGLIFLFIITLLMFAIHLARSTAKMEQERAKVTRINMALERTTASLSDVSRWRHELMDDIKAGARSAGLDVMIVPETGTIDLLADHVLFPSGSDQLTVGGQEKLRNLGQILLDVLPLRLAETTGPVSQGGATFRKRGFEAILIEGHTDSLALPVGGKFKDNWDLSAARAVATYRALCDAYPGLHELKNVRGERLLGVAGYGPDRPTAAGSNESREGRARNRRVTVRFLVTPGELTAGAPAREGPP